MIKAHIKNDSTNKKIEYLAYGVVLIMVFILGLKKLYSPDIGFHLEAGRWMMENGSVMRSDVLTYSGSGTPYYDLNWLYQISVYQIFRLFSATGLVLFNSLLVTLSVVMLYLRMRAIGISKFHLALLLFIIAIVPFPMEVRPHVVSILFLNILLYILELYRFKNVNRLFLLPIVILIWINFHSMGILGIVVIGIYTAGIFWEEKKIDKRLVSYLLLSVFAMIITPFLFNGFLFIFKQFAIVSNNGEMKQYVGELASTLNVKGVEKYGISYLIKPYFLLQVFMLISVIASVKLFRIKQFIMFLICTIFLLLLCLAEKNYVYFLFVVFPYIVFVSTKKTKERAKDSKISNYFTPYRMYSISLIMAIIIAWTTITGGFRIITDDPVGFGTQIDRQYLPVDATEFLNNYKINGRILNYFDFGGYLEYFYTEKTFIDGRLEVISNSRFHEYYNSTNTNQGLNSLIVKYQPEIIMFPYFKAEKWWAVMLHNPDWRLIYVDHIAAIYVPKNKFPSIPTITEELILRKIPGYYPEQIFEVLKQNKNSKTIAFFKSFFKKQNAAKDYETLSMFCYASGFTNAAVALSVATIQEATYSPSTTYFNLYHFFSRYGNYEMANYCLLKSGKQADDTDIY